MLTGSCEGRPIRGGYVKIVSPPDGTASAPTSPHPVYDSYALTTSIRDWRLFGTVTITALAILLCLVALSSAVTEGERRRC